MSKLKFLDQLPIFAYLTEAQLREVAAISSEYEFDADAVLAYQRDVANHLFIVRSGRLFARSVDEGGVVRDSRSFFAGDYFDDVWLFTAMAHPATVKAATDGRVLIITQEDFLGFLHRQPEALANLAPEYDDEGEHVAGLSPEAWEEANKIDVAPVKRQMDVGELEKDELIEFSTRRSRWLLALKLIPWLLVFLLGFALFWFARGQLAILSSVPATVAVLTVLAAITVFGSIYQFLDWRNDYFVITTRHIIHYEVSLSPRNFGTTINRTPVDQVQSVEVDRPNLLSNLFNVGTARVTTAAQAGVVYFDFIDDPIAVRDTITAIQKRVRQLDAGREQAVMRESLENHFNAGEPYRSIDDDEDMVLAATDKRDESFLRRLVRGFSYRVVDGDVVTYRKHVFVLLAQLGWPLLVMFILFLVALVVAYSSVTLGFFWVVPGIIFAVNIGWLVWRVEDWRNDTFQVTPRYVIDIDRSPFGTGETRRQAELANVQNVNADRPGLLPTLFNYGNVYIETAGASADITFESVVNPNQVQRDIFQNREALQRKKRLAEGSQRRKEYAVLLDVYKQALEQGRIPRRTPPTEQEI